MLSGLGEGRWWEEGSGSNPTMAVDWGREGVRQQSVCWWGHVHWRRDKREGSVVCGGN